MIPGKVQEAIDYFEKAGFIEDLTTDKKYYVEILINHIKNAAK